MTQSRDKPDEPSDVSQSRTSTSLLQAAVEDDASGWRRLVGLYSPTVYTWLRRRGVSAEDAADICQDVMRSVSRNLASFVPDGSPASFRRWLQRITQRRLVDFYRRQEVHVHRARGGSSVWPQIADGAHSPTSSEEEDRAEFRLPEPYRRAIDQVRGEFAQRNWLIFWRVMVDECETADVAEEFSVSTNVVRLAKSRITRRLREVLEDMKDAVSEGKEQRKM